MKKSIPKGMFDSKSYKKFFEDVEIDEAEIATSIGSGGTAGLDMG